YLLLRRMRRVFAREDDVRGEGCFCGAYSVFQVGERDCQRVDQTGAPGVDPLARDGVEYRRWTATAGLVHDRTRLETGVLGDDAHRFGKRACQRVEAQRFVMLRIERCQGRTTGQARRAAAWHDPVAD